MHRELKSLLAKATGDSQFVVVVILDVRGFSSFARMAESSESAIFLKRAYTVILEEYFDDASFFKPTGDGLLVVLEYDADSLSQVVERAVATSVDLVEAFPTICAADPMVNFQVPTELGVGLARGAATCLRSGEMTLDYSGRPLNLAARLMDVARPAGVVFSDSMGIDLLSPALASRFTSDEVYITGLAEDAPMGIHYLVGRTTVSDSYRRPLGKTKIHAERVQEYTVRELEGMGNFRFALTADPLDRGQIELVAFHPDATPSGRQRKGIHVRTTAPAKYGEDAQGPHVRVSLPSLANRLKEKGIKGTWECKICIEYAVADLAAPGMAEAV